MEHIIEINIGEDNSKTAMFETIAIANGWTEKIQIPVNKEKVVKGGQEKYDAHYQSLLEKPGFKWLGAFEIDENSERHTWQETEESDAMSASETWKEILVAFMMKIYWDSLLKIETPEEAELKKLNIEKKKATEDSIKDIKVTVN